MDFGAMLFAIVFAAMVYRLVSGVGKSSSSRTTNSPSAPSMSSMIDRRCKQCGAKWKDWPDNLCKCPNCNIYP